MQELFRVRKLKIQNEIRKSNVKRPFRIRIHDIQLLVPKQSRLISSMIAYSNSSPTSAPISSTSNNNTTPITSNTPSTATTANNISQLPKSSLQFVGEMTSIVYENVFGVADQKTSVPCIRDKDREIIDLLTQGN